jgi:stage V sporulation protein SpoVS
LNRPLRWIGRAEISAHDPDEAMGLRFNVNHQATPTAWGAAALHASAAALFSHGAARQAIGASQIRQALIATTQARRALCEDGEFGIPDQE